MKPIRVRSSKYDASLRDTYDAFLCAEDAESVLVYVPPGTHCYDYRTRSWSVAPDGVLERYFKRRWYTIWYICEQHSGQNAMYIHLSMPCDALAFGIDWVDLDIDYRVHCDGRVERLDDDEYQAHRVSMGYPAALDAQVQGACAEIEACCSGQRYPFDHATHVALYRQIAARHQR
jgi:protein associated with RNAse G/E